MDRTILQVDGSPQSIAWNKSGDILGCLFPSVPKDVVTSRSTTTDTQLMIVTLAQYPSKVKTRWIDAKPHSKPPTCLTFIRTDNTDLVTGGKDHLLALWKITETKSMTTTLHNLHTSEISALCSHSAGDFLFSGDRKFVCWSLKQNKKVFLIQLSEKISTIKESPVAPDILLVGYDFLVFG